MSAYILMRSNKQSGPFTKEELIRIGFKPYDLIWIEGKSAMWRYPSEVPELMEYASVVEEQPYDRFYKKKTDEQKDEKIPEAETIIAKKEPEPEAVTIKNGHVSVIMPRQPAAQAKKEIPAPSQTAAPVKKESPSYSQIPATAIKEDPVNLTPASNSGKEASAYSTSYSSAYDGSGTGRTVDVETKYAESLDEIKERYVRQLQQRKHKAIQKKFIVQALKNAAIILGIAGSGVLIGFIIKPKHSSKIQEPKSAVKVISPETTQPLTNDDLVQTTNNDPGKNITVTSRNTQNENKIDEEVKKSVSNTESRADNAAGKIEKKKVNTPDEELVSIQPVQSATFNSANGERNKNARNINEEKESVEKRTATKAEIAKLVSVKANKYKLRDFGGFRNLELTVTNDSKITLDKVLVEVQYLNINDQPLKIENIPFQSIDPGSTLSVRVPDNKRGAKLIYRIIKIEAEDLSLR